ncbi:MAG: ArgE/DapE family deacylase [Lapillicoccus sp.]
MSPLTPDERRALDAVDRDAIAVALTELMAVPSVGGSAAETDIQYLLATRLATLDLDVDLWAMDLPTLTSSPAFPGSEVERSEAWGLVGTAAGEGDRPAMVLQGHVDVVPAGDPARWGNNPFDPTWRGSRVHGRGACDMKAGVVANLAAYTAVVRSGTRLRGGCALHFVIGEEDGGLGAFGALQRGHGGDGCIITEPTGGTVITAAAGALTFTLELTGVATHASTPYAGHSAVDSYLLVHRALAALSERRNAVVEPLMREYPVPYPIVVGRLRAGDWSSTVPDRLVAEGRFGLRIEEDPADGRRELTECVQDVAASDPFLRDHPPTLSWSGGQFAGGHLPAGASLLGLVTGAHADVAGGESIRERGAPYGSDLRLYAAAGTPTLHYGPGDVRLAHGPDESVDLDEVVTVTEALVLALVRACGTR